ncbi:hypothetical protein L798_07290 [Zootermopsis nevadensis]|uniref:DUF4781 domain-containing protein n=1 Tax=Zootermopsis nevadensis TaxID=136037 RepID=A0A067R637_ZOONE|nr:hypothetical protein L798_07290 [Zootermopsis nevadensis]
MAESAEKETWHEEAKEEQQWYYELFGDRDWDSYKEVEMEYLERNVGHAIYGPPEKLPDERTNGNTGYETEELEHIRKVCATIKKHGRNLSKCNDSDILMSVIFVCLNVEERSRRVAVFRIPRYDPEDKSKQCLNQFVDQNCRVYEDWDDFLSNNLLPKCTYCYPAGGVYDGDENDKVLLGFGETPASKAVSKVFSVLDTASTVVTVSFCSWGIS